MPTLYVERVPGDLYEALRSQARARHRSIAAEVLALLEENVPTRKEMRARQELLRLAQRLSSKRASEKGKVTPTEELLRQDRDR